MKKEKNSPLNKFFSNSDNNLTDILTRLPGKNEVYNAIMSQKNDKAVGYDYLPIEIIKRHINIYTNIIHNLLNKYTINPDWGKGIPALLFKKE